MSIEANIKNLQKKIINRDVGKVQEWIHQEESKPTPSKGLIESYHSMIESIKTDDLKIYEEVERLELEYHLIKGQAERLIEDPRLLYFYDNVMFKLFLSEGFYELAQLTYDIVNELLILEPHKRQVIFSYIMFADYILHIYHNPKLEGKLLDLFDEMFKNHISIRKLLKLRGIKANKLSYSHYKPVVKYVNQNENTLLSLAELQSFRKENPPEWAKLSVLKFYEYGFLFDWVHFRQNKWVERLNLTAVEQLPKHCHLFQWTLDPKIRLDSNKEHLASIKKFTKTVQGFKLVI